MIALRGMASHVGSRRVAESAEFFDRIYRIIRINMEAFMIFALSWSVFYF